MIRILVAALVLCGCGATPYVTSDYETAPTIVIHPILPSLDAPAIATVSAIRIRPPSPITRDEHTPMPAAPTGIMGLPFAPANMTGCDEMTFYREQFQLPPRFDGLGYRESRCTNTPISSTGCCVGYWQLHSIIFRDHRMIEGLAACGATWQNVRGDDPASKQRNACAAKQLFDTAGYQAWAL
jgi:hypothetical protein